MWNYIMKNFQVKHGQCDSIIFPKTFTFENSKRLLDLCLPESRILYFWQVLESICKFITEHHSLQCLFVRGSNKQQRKGRIILNFTKRQSLPSLMTTLGCNFKMRPSFLHSLKKAFLSSLLWLRRKYTWTLNWKERLLIYFENCQGVPYSHRQSRNRMMNTFIIVHNIPHVRDGLEDKSMLFTYFYLM